MEVFIKCCALIALCLTYASAQDSPHGYTIPNAWRHINWLMGKWHSPYDGKVTWPHTPSTTYGEYIEFMPAEFSLENGLALVRVMSYSWAHSTQDRLMDLHGYLYIEDNGQRSEAPAYFMSTMNNGFNTLENGTATYGLLKFVLSEIGRISIARQIPVEDVHREFRSINSEYMEQIVSMRTVEQPVSGVLEHARILYKKVREPTTTAPPPTTPAAIPVEPVAPAQENIPVPAEVQLQAVQESPRSFDY